MNIAILQNTDENKLSHLEMFSNFTNFYQL